MNKIKKTSIKKSLKESPKGKSKNSENIFGNYIALFTKEIPDFWDEENPLRKTYSKSLLKKICKKLDISDPKETYHFLAGISYAGIRYLELKNNNKGRIPLNKQIKILDGFHKTIKQAQSDYKNVQKHIETRTKYHSALKTQIDLLPKDSPLIEMFSPYVTIGDGKKELSGMSPQIFSDFLTILIESSKKSKSLKIGTDRTNLAPNYLAWWIASIRAEWPETSPIPFGLGRYLKEDNGYKSMSLEILDDLISSLDPEVSLPELTTAMRKVIKTDASISPAKFILAST